MEKKNDDVRRNFHRKISRWDACGSLMKIEKRQEMLSPHEREKRLYEKKCRPLGERGETSTSFKIPTHPLNHCFCLMGVIRINKKMHIDKKKN